MSKAKAAPPIDPAIKNGAIAAGAWFLLKAIAGNSTVNSWLGSLLAFSVCTVLAGTIGFVWQVFFIGLIGLSSFLKLLELLFGHGIFDLIILLLIASYHTKPTEKSFDGRPTREMQKVQTTVNQEERAAVGRTRRPPGNFFEHLVAEGQKVVKGIAADAMDANVPMEFADYFVIMVATAKFSEKPDENVYYIGCFRKWFNVSGSLILLAVRIDRFARDFDLDGSQNRPRRRDEYTSPHRRPR